MNKQFIFSIAVFLICLSLLLGQRKAEALADRDPGLGFTSSYIMDSRSPDETLKNAFGLNEAPYIFMELPESNAEFVISFLQDTGSISSPSATSGELAAKKQLTPDDRKSREKAGEWPIGSSEFNSNAAGFVNFAVTSEPLAIVLFLIGGAPIAVSLYRKKKKVSIAV